MTQSQFETVLAAVPRLSRSQLDQLSKEVSAARQMAKEGGAVNDELLGYICAYCRKHKTDFRNPFKMRESKHYKAFMEKHGEVLEYLGSFCKSKIEREAICCLVFDEIRRAGIVPPNCVGLMTVVHLIPAKIDEMFPGYEDMGLLPLIARRLAAS